MALGVDVAVLLFVALHALLPTAANAALQDGFYRSNTNCSVDVEATVMSVVQQYLSADRGVGAGLIRLHFHDCFVKSLPPPFAELDQLTGLFAAKGFTADELVTLSGAHSVGRAHCASFSQRIRPNVSDTMDAEYGAGLQQQCPPDAGADVAVDQDQATPADLDNRYYGNVLAGKVLFNSDWALISDGTTRRMVEDSAADPGRWAAKFGDAMRKMGALDVLTGDQGEIRRFCHVTNSG
ncbi:hypothetical protein EJB05_30938, partial [Eragrostis curvula]